MSQFKIYEDNAKNNSEKKKRKGRFRKFYYCIIYICIEPYYGNLFHYEYT